MTYEPPMWMQSGADETDIEYSARQYRAGLLAALFSREGVLFPDEGQLRLSPRAAGPNYSFDVAPGRAAIFGDDVSDQGCYLCTNSAVKNITQFSNGTAITRPASGSRRHRVIARVKDKMHRGIWSGYEWDVAALQDTGSGPPEPGDSAVTLGYLPMTSTMTAIQAANVENIPDRASIGTIAREGTFNTISAYTATQSARRPAWHVNPDGWVMLGGWVMRTDPNTPITANSIYEMAPAGALPEAARPLQNVRDFGGWCALGPIHWIVRPNGSIAWRPMFSGTLSQNNTWFSFDGCGYHL